MKKGETLSFEYRLDCGGEDAFLFGVNGDLAYSDTGEMLGWKSYTFTAPKNGEYEFEWVFQVGGSNHGTQQCLQIDNVSYSGSVYVGSGDVNLDRLIDTEDALLALRAALGISGLPEEQAIEADVTGNGVIDTEDALVILRMALGIQPGE